MSVEDNFEHYIRPQENLVALRHRLGNCKGYDGHGLFFRDMSCLNSANASHFTSEMITRTRHDFELVALKNTVVNLDWRITSMSSNAQLPR